MCSGQRDKMGSCNAREMLKEIKRTCSERRNRHYCLVSRSDHMTQQEYMLNLLNLASFFSLEFNLILFRLTQLLSLSYLVVWSQKLVAEY